MRTEQHRNTLLLMVQAMVCVSYASWPVRACEEGPLSLEENLDAAKHILHLTCKFRPSDGPSRLYDCSVKTVLLGDAPPATIVLKQAGRGSFLATPPDGVFEVLLFLRYGQIQAETSVQACVAFILEGPNRTAAQELDRFLKARCHEDPVKALEAMRTVALEQCIGLQDKAYMRAGAANELLRLIQAKKLSLSKDEAAKLTKAALGSQDRECVEPCALLADNLGLGEAEDLLLKAALLNATQGLSRKYNRLLQPLRRRTETLTPRMFAVAREMRNANHILSLLCFALDAPEGLFIKEAEELWRRNPASREALRLVLGGRDRPEGFRTALQRLEKETKEK